MKIEFNPTELLSFEKVINPANIKLVFFFAIAVKMIDAIVSLIRLFHYRFDGYSFMGILTGFVFFGLTTYLACQLLLALQQKCSAGAKPAPAPETKAEPPPPQA